MKEEVAPSNVPPPPHVDMPVGEILRRAREHYGQSLDDVERYLRIRASQLEAIEKGQIDKLPGRVYAIGFIRTYSEYLGLDGTRMIELFKAQGNVVDIRPQIGFAVSASDSHVPAKWIVVACLFVTLGIVGGLSYYFKQDRSLVDEMPPPQIAQNIENSVYGPVATGFDISDPMTSESHQVASGIDAASIEPANGQPVDDGKTVSSESSGQDELSIQQQASIQTDSPSVAPAVQQTPEIILDVLENSWIEIKENSGKVLVSKVLKAGERYYIPNRPDLMMSVGNAGGISLSLDGKPVPPLGARGEIRKDIPLDDESLAALMQGH